MNGIEKGSKANLFNSQIVSMKSNLESLSTELVYPKERTELEHFLGLVRDNKRLIELRVHGPLVTMESYGVFCITIGNKIDVNIKISYAEDTSSGNVNTPVSEVVVEPGIGTSPDNVNIPVTEVVAEPGIGTSPKPYPKTYIPVRPDMKCSIKLTPENWIFRGLAFVDGYPFDFWDDMSFLVNAETLKGHFKWKKYYLEYFECIQTFNVIVEPTWETIG